MTSKQKGDIGEQKIALEAMKQGYKVCWPFGDDHRFDLVIYKDDGDFLKVQCKYAGRYTDKVWVKARSNRVQGQQKYLASEVDLLAAYHPATDLVFFIPVSEVSDHSEFCLRIASTSNKAGRKARWAQDYLLIRD